MNIIYSIIMVALVGLALTAQTGLARVENYKQIDSVLTYTFRTSMSLQARRHLPGIKKRKSITDHCSPNGISLSRERFPDSFL
jgi:hypothetical protein